MLRPRVRIPLWAAVAIAAAAYLVRSVARGSFRPDLPQDAVVFGALLFVLALGALYGAAQRRNTGSDGELERRHGDEDHPGEHHEV